MIHFGLNMNAEVIRFRNTTSFNELIPFARGSESSIVVDVVRVRSDVVEKFVAITTCAT